MTLPVITTSTLTSDYAWNETAGRYISISSGRFVPFNDVRDALESVIDMSASRMNAVTQQLIDGQIQLAEWQTVMMDQIKQAHTAAAAASRGGWAQMSLVS